MDAEAAHFTERPLGNLEKSARAREGGKDLEGIPCRAPLPGCTRDGVSLRLDLGKGGKKFRLHQGRRVLIEEGTIGFPCRGWRFVKVRLQGGCELNGFMHSVITPVQAHHRG